MTARQARKIRVSFVVLGLVAFVILTGFGWQQYKNNQFNDRTRELSEQNRVLAEQGVAAHEALCGYRADLQAKIKKDDEFLAHPPKNVFGITVDAAVIAQVTANRASRQAILNSFGNLNCVEPKKETTTTTTTG